MPNCADSSHGLEPMAFASCRSHGDLRGESAAVTEFEGMRDIMQQADAGEADKALLLVECVAAAKARIREQDDFARVAPARFLQRQIEQAPCEASSAQSRGDINLAKLID